VIRKPGNLILLIFAVCVFGDVLLVRPNNEGDFLISIGILGALLSRAFLEDAQSIAVCLLGLSLTLIAVLRNHNILDRESDFWFCVSLLTAFTYALWEKLVGWFST